MYCVFYADKTYDETSKILNSGCETNLLYWAYIFCLWGCQFVHLLEQHFLTIRVIVWYFPHEVNCNLKSLCASIQMNGRSFLCIQGNTSPMTSLLVKTLPFSISLVATFSKFSSLNNMMIIY